MGANSPGLPVISVFMIYCVPQAYLSVPMEQSPNGTLCSASVGASAPCRPKNFASHTKVVVIGVGSDTTAPTFLRTVTSVHTDKKM